MSPAPGRKPIISAVVSGFLSYAGVWLLGVVPGGPAVARNSGVYLPGVLFGALVMAPAAPRGLRRWLAVGLSTLTYYLAVKLAMHQAVSLHMREIVSCAIAGLLGAFAIAAEARFALSIDVSPRQAAQAALIGAVTGTIFGIRGDFPLPSALEPLTLILGFVAWQTGVALTLLRQAPGLSLSL